MKLFTLLFSGLLVSVLFVNAQDWQTVRSGRIAYFQDYNGQVKCIRIDSVKFQSDSILYPMPHIQQLDYNCFRAKGNSWVGEKVILQSNGINLFFNNEQDTIRINTLAKVGDNWTLFEIKDSIKIIAEVLTSEIQSVLGEADSVKTIGLKVYDENGPEDNHPLNGKTIILSKNNGLVKAMSFNEFPEDRQFTYFENLEALNLIGLTNPDRGVQNLTWMGVHDFQAGDEIHIQKRSWDWSSDNKFHYTYKTGLKFLERKESKDAVFYRIEKKESLKRIIDKWENVSYVFTHDTITSEYRADSLFDKLSGEPIVSEYGADANVMYNEGVFIKKVRSYIPISKSDDDNCWHMLMWDGSGPGFYLKGLGGPYYDWSEINRGEINTLEYYKKGSVTWGTPLVITDVKSLENEDLLKIYPNPASDFVMLETLSGRTENYELQLIDMQGREVLKKSISLANSYQLEVSSLKEGAYMLKLQNEEKQVTRVIVIKH